MVEVVRAAVAASTAEECGSLHRAIAAQQVTWPVSPADQESPLVGLYAAVRETAEVDGAIVECGVARGGSLVPLARANLDEYREPRWPGATLAVDEAFTDMAHRPSWDDLIHRYVARVPPREQADGPRG